MPTRVRTTVHYDVIAGWFIRVDGLVRRYGRNLTREVVQVAKLKVTTDSRARYRGQFPRTGRLARSISDRHQWANQHGVGRTVRVGEGYGRFVMKGTAGMGGGMIRRAQARGPQGRFERGRAGEGRTKGMLPVGLSQGRLTHYALAVRGQYPNPFVENAVQDVMRRWGLLSP